MPRHTDLQRRYFDQLVARAKLTPEDVDTLRRYRKLSPDMEKWTVGQMRSMIDIVNKWDRDIRKQIDRQLARERRRKEQQRAARQPPKRPSMEDWLARHQPKEVTDT